MKEVESHDDIKLASLPDKKPLTFKQLMEFIAKDTTDMFWLAENRHKYKVRKNVQLSDAEYDALLVEAINKITMIRISSAVMFELVKKIDSANKKVQKGKEPSIMDQYKLMMKEINDEARTDNQHSKSDLQPVREGEREEGKEA